MDQTEDLHIVRIYSQDKHDFIYLELGDPIDRNFINDKPVDRYIQIQDITGRRVFINDIYVNEEGNLYQVVRGTYKIGFMSLYGDYLKHINGHIDENIGHVMSCVYKGNIHQDSKLLK